MAMAEWWSPPIPTSPDKLDCCAITVSTRTMPRTFWDKTAGSMKFTQQYCRSNSGSSNSGTTRGAPWQLNTGRHSGSCRLAYRSRPDRATTICSSLRRRERDKLRAHLASLNIPTLVHYPIPLHRQKAFAEFTPDSLPKRRSSVLTGFKLADARISQRQ